MKKLYKINQFTAAEWDAIEYDWNEHEDEIVIIEEKDAYCMDITANGKRIVPILRKIEEAMTAAGLAGESGIFAGWFGEWANELTGSYFDRKNFIWDYSGRSDQERGCWSYSWGIEQIDDDRWYIFLNIAKPQEETEETETEETTAPAEAQTTDTDTEEEEEAQNMKPEVIFPRIREEVEARTERSAWSRGVTAYALDLVDELEEATEGGYFDLSDLEAPKLVDRALLNGATDWNQYSWGGCSLCYDGQIAERLCTPSELKKTRHGERRPNSREEWLDTQARALFQAASRVKKSIRAALKV